MFRTTYIGLAIVFVNFIRSNHAGVAVRSRTGIDDGMIFFFYSGVSYFFL